MLSGLIPAHAGKTIVAAYAGKRGTAHPRSRGENVTPYGGMVLDPGSSPLTRGKQDRERTHPPRRRLIPAHAGKTWSFNSDTSVTWAHPRSRGENPWGSATPGDLLGSSPLTRGKRVETIPHVRAGGLIPAHAGKTFARA